MIVPRRVLRAEHHGSLRNGANLLERESRRQTVLLGNLPNPSLPLMKIKFCRLRSMRTLSLMFLLLPCTVAIAAVDASTRLLPLRPLVHLPARAAVAHLSVSMPESTEQLEQWPTELLGPWELRTTQPGSSSRMWVELADDRSCSCSAAVGKGSRWHAIRRGGKWQLSFVLLDKLKREVKYEGEVREDDGTSSRRLVIAGSINGPPRRMAGLSGAALKLQLERGEKVGEFEGWRLE